MMDAEPLVSVLSPAYRCAAFLAPMVASVRAQSWTNWELIVVDDGSDDGQDELLDRLAAEEPRLRWRRTGHAGYAGAFNAALAEARGDFIARQDADDWSAPDRLARQMAALGVGGRGGPPADICSCGICRWDLEGRPLGRFVTGMVPQRFLHDDLPRGPGGATCLARRAVYELVGGLDAACELSGDSDWYLRALLHTPPLRWVHVDRDLYHYRFHPGQIQRRAGAAALAVHRARRDYWRPQILARHGYGELAAMCRLEVGDGPARDR